jgi:hypothetical protein
MAVRRVNQAAAIRKRRYRGSIGDGCLTPEVVDDVHLFRDLQAGFTRPEEKPSDFQPLLFLAAIDGPFILRTSRWEIRR